MDSSKPTVDNTKKVDKDLHKKALKGGIVNAINEANEFADKLYLESKDNEWADLGKEYELYNGDSKKIKAYGKIFHLCIKMYLLRQGLPANEISEKPGNLLGKHKGAKQIADKLFLELQQINKAPEKNASAEEKLKWEVKQLLWAEGKYAAQQQGNKVLKTLAGLGALGSAAAIGSGVTATVISKEVAAAAGAALKDIGSGSFKKLGAEFAASNPIIIAFTAAVVLGLTGLVTAILSSTEAQAKREGKGESLAYLYKMISVEMEKVVEPSGLPLSQ